jgi:hypothetical protein
VLEGVLEVLLFLTQNVIRPPLRIPLQQHCGDDYGRTLASVTAIAL